MNDDVIIKADGLYFSYDGDNRHSLNGLSLEIRRGKKYAFMGANGSGKSTFFLCCNGIHRPEKGTLYFDGKPVDYSRKGLLELRQRVGIIFQDPDDQLFSASVFQEISFGVLNLGVTEAQARKEVESVIHKMEISPFRDRPTHALSGGQKKQVSIADILVMHPDVIILDEPAAALDPKHTKMVNETVDKMTKEGITVLMATHDVNYAFSWADEIMLMKDGVLLTHGSPVEVFSNKKYLKETNLEQPAALELYDSLVSRGILSDNMPVPSNLKELENRIADVHLSEPAKETDFSDPAATPVFRQQKKAVLAVSFGTSFENTRKVTIDAIEKDLAAAFPDATVYRAWTSGMILKKLQKQGIHYDNVREAFERMRADDITDVIVQPTHVINGVENELMIQTGLGFRPYFSSVSFGSPLLTTQEDNQYIVNAMQQEFSGLRDDEALVFMGHGTTHYANTVYAAMDYLFKDSGFERIHLGTVESYPSFDSILSKIRISVPRRVILAPFMVVAGDHATHDMSGDDPGSWKSRFEAEGYEVKCIMKGLGEYPSVRRLYVEHAKHAAEISLT